MNSPSISDDLLSWGDIPTLKETLLPPPLTGEGNTRARNITPGIPPRQLTDIPAGLLRVAPNVTSGIPPSSD